MTSATLPALLESAGLTGRGGAAFATHVKIAAATHAGADLIVNVCDGELGAAKDGWVVTHHLPEVVAGASLVTSRRGRRIRYAAHRGSATASRLAAAGLDVLEVPARYVSSEETALISLAHGHLARPMTKRDRFVSGGRDSAGHTIEPTVVLNAETVWRVAQIADRGAPWFRSFGTAAEPGPRLVSVSRSRHPGMPPSPSSLASAQTGQNAHLGHFVPRAERDAGSCRARGESPASARAGEDEHLGHFGSPVVLETEAGVPVAELLRRGGIPDDHGAILLNGLGGAFLTATEARGALWCGAGLTAYGTGIGPGVIHALDPRGCPLAWVREILTWAGGESAGQCGPCLFGVPALARDWAALVASPTPELLAQVRSRVALLPGRGACRYPDGVAGFAASALRLFEADLVAHRSGRCAGGIPVDRPITSERKAHAGV